jgi:hypothetical protein
MKFSKAALKVRHIQVAHLTELGDKHLRDEPPAAPARRYSTEWYDPAPKTNGIAIPQQLRDRIEASMKAASPELENAPAPQLTETDEDKPMFLGWGFF